MGRYDGLLGSDRGWGVIAFLIAWGALSALAGIVWGVAILYSHLHVEWVK